MTRLSFLGSLTVAVLVAAPAAAQDGVTDILRARVESFRQGGALTVQGVALQSIDLLPDFYADRGYRPAWTAPGRLDALLSEVRASVEDGLTPRDYLLEPLERLTRGTSSGASGDTLRADVDLLATEALIRLAFSLRYGKVDPRRLDPAWNIRSAAAPRQAVQALGALISSDTLKRAVAALAPRHPLYVHLRDELARYRAIDSAGGLPTIEPGPNLGVGMTDARVPVLRRRLVATGDLSPDDASRSDSLYDRTVAEGVTRYQSRLGLAPDGILGIQTRAELNVAPAARIKTIRVNLERGRWVLPGLGATFVAVNIAAYQAYFLRDDSLAWSGRAVVGQPYLQTPEFRARMTSIVLNPTWTVPPQILTDEVLPAIRRDPGYLARHSMQVVNRDGAVVDPAGIDWDAYDGRTLPYRIVQTPGGGNPLGRIKFLLPNDYLVYLHDTPSRAMFQRPRRTFSHGCIRLQDPVALATLLLDDSAWTAAALDSVIALGQEATVPLKRPVPVLLLYWTAWTALDGALNFRPDVYGRDAGILAALDAPFAFHRVVP